MGHTIGPRTSITIRKPTARQLLDIVPTQHPSADALERSIEILIFAVSLLSQTGFV
jgi:hypothetical protein